LYQAGSPFDRGHPLRRHLCFDDANASSQAARQTQQPDWVLDVVQQPEQHDDVEGAEIVGRSAVDIPLLNADIVQAERARHEARVGDVIRPRVDGKYMPAVSSGKIDREVPLVTGHVNDGERVPPVPNDRIEHAEEHLEPGLVDRRDRFGKVRMRAKPVRKLEVVEPAARSNLVVEAGVAHRLVLNG
jgi:hypothetical protein